MSVPTQIFQYYPPLGSVGGTGLPVGVTAGAVPAWDGFAYVPSLFVTDVNGDPISDSNGNLVLVEDD